MAANQRALVAALLNEAKDQEKELKILSLKQLYKTLRQDKALLTEFLPNLLELRSTRSVVVRKRVIKIIQNFCRENPECVPLCISHLIALVRDECTAVAKAAIIASACVYRAGLCLLCSQTGGFIPDSMRATVSFLTTLSRAVLSHDSTDTLRVVVAKFSSSLVLALTTAAQSRPSSNDIYLFNLSDIPPRHPMLNQQELASEGERLLASLLQQLQVSSLSYMVKIALVNALEPVGVRRPSTQPRILTALAALATSAPDLGLKQSQSKSLLRSIRAVLLSFLRHADSQGVVDRICDVLHLLGAEHVTPADVVLRRLAKTITNFKRPAVLLDNDDDVAPPPAKRAHISGASPMSMTSAPSDFDDRRRPPSAPAPEIEALAALVISSVANLPAVAPPYTPELAQAYETLMQVMQVFCPSGDLFATGNGSGSGSGGSGSGATTDAGADAKRAAAPAPIAPSDPRIKHLRRETAAVT